MPAPERRTRLDLVVAAALALAVVVAGSVVWVRSDARATVSEPAAVALPDPVAATAVPASFTELWRAPSAATTAPVVAAGAVVSADGSTVQGRDPATGDVVWTYGRDLPLCGVAGQWQRAVAVFRDGRGCSEVTAVDGATGERGPQRSSAADDAVVLVGDGTYLASVGATRTEVWRSDLVRTLELGRVDAPVVPSAQTRTGCTTGSVATGGSRLAVVLTCPEQPDPQLVLLDSSPEGDERVPVELGSAVLAAPGALVLAVTAERAAVFLPTAADGTPQPRVAVFDSTAALLGEYPVDVVADPARPSDAPAAAALTTTATVLSWSVGGSVVGLSPTDLTPRWTLPDALGPGTELAGSLVVPVEGGLAVVDPATGTTDTVVPVDRSGYDRAQDGPVRTGVSGSVVLEQRGGELVALG